MQLDGLTYGDVDQIAAVLGSYVRDHLDLLRASYPVGQRNAHHEVLGRFAFPALAAECAGPVALGVNTPPFEIRGGPFRENRFPAGSGEGTNFVQCLPWVLLPLKPLHALGFCFLNLGHRYLPPECKQNRKT